MTMIQGVVQAEPKRSKDILWELYEELTEQLDRVAQKVEYWRIEGQSAFRRKDTRQVKHAARRLFKWARLQRAVEAKLDDVNRELYSLGEI